MSVDSKAVFSARLAELGLSSFQAKFTAKGWDSQGTFAFASSFSTSGPDETSFTSTICPAILDAEEHPSKAALRRFHYECFMVTTHDLANRTQRTDEEVDKPLKLPAPERAARINELRDANPGLEIKGVNEPSCKLVDKLVAMQSSGHLRWLKWEELSRRDYEIAGVQTEEFWKVDKATGLFKRFEGSSDIKADTDSDLKLLQAFTRRGVAYHVAKLINYKKHEVLVKRYFAELDREAVPGFQRIDLGQIHRADMEIFTQLAETNDGVLPVVAAPAMSLDDSLDAAMASERFKLLMIPQQKPSNSGKRQPSDSYDSKEIQRLREKVRKLEQQPGKGKGWSSQPNNPKGSGKGNSRDLQTSIINNTIVRHGKKLVS